MTRSKPHPVPDLPEPASRKLLPAEIRHQGALIMLLAGRLELPVAELCQALDDTEIRLAHDRLCIPHAVLGVLRRIPKSRGGAA